MEPIKELMETMNGLVENGAILLVSSTCKCDKCHDSGWLETTDEEGRHFVRKCACRLAREAERKIENSGLGDAIQHQTFDSFVSETPVQEAVKNKAKQYLDELIHGNMPWFYIGGSPGSGKTHICTAICGELLKHNIGVKYMQWLQESRRLKMLVNDEYFEEHVKGYINTPVLYIDDLFKQKWTECPTFSDADIKIAFTILNARYLMNKPTIISAEWNLLDQLMEADEGVFSRVYERSKGYAIYIDRKSENNYRLREE